MGERCAKEEHLMPDEDELKTVPILEEHGTGANWDIRGGGRIRFMKGENVTVKSGIS